MGTDSIRPSVQAHQTMSTFRASAASLGPPGKNPAPQAAERSGQTQAWEGPARATHCRLPPSHAQPGDYLGGTRPPASPHLPPRAAPLPSIPRSLHPPSIPQAAPGPPTSTLVARRSPSTLRPPEPRTRSLAGVVVGLSQARMRVRTFARTCTSARRVDALREPPTHL